MPCRITPEAEQDLDGIFLYWAKQASLSVADRLIETIVERFELLGDYPNAGIACDDLAAGVRCFPAGKYLIYYRQDHTSVDILHIFHSVQEVNSGKN